MPRRVRPLAWRWLLVLHRKFLWTPSPKIWSLFISRKTMQSPLSLQLKIQGGFGCGCKQTSWVSLGIGSQRQCSQAEVPGFSWRFKFLGWEHNLSQLRGATDLSPQTCLEQVSQTPRFAFSHNLGGKRFCCVLRLKKNYFCQLDIDLGPTLLPTEQAQTLILRCDSSTLGYWPFLVKFRSFKR